MAYDIVSVSKDEMNVFVSANLPHHDFHIWNKTNKDMGIFLVTWYFHKLKAEYGAKFSCKYQTSRHVCETVGIATRLICYLHVISVTLQRQQCCKYQVTSVTYNRFSSKLPVSVLVMSCRSNNEADKTSCIGLQREYTCTLDGMLSSILGTTIKRRLPACPAALAHGGNYIDNKNENRMKY